MVGIGDGDGAYPLPCWRVRDLGRAGWTCFGIVENDLVIVLIVWYRMV